MMNCADYQELLQSRLDGDEIPESPAALRHLEECHRCRALETAAVKLMGSFGAAIVPPPGLSERIVRSLVRTRRRQVVIRTAAVFAMAASVMLAVYVGFIWTRGAPEAATNSIVALTEPKTDGASEFRTNVESAYGALTGIVNQTAEKALEPGRVLLPDRNSVAFLTETAKLQQPQVPSLRGAGQGVAEFAPVTSLGRFFNYFAQDIPGMEPKGKADS